MEYQAELKDWIRFQNQKLVPDTMPAGDLKVDFKMDRSFEGAGTKDRSDEVVTRVTCKVVDVKPNKTLVIEGRSFVDTDGEKQYLTLTGTCRGRDVTPQNTVLSSQIAGLDIDVKDMGAVRDATRRGWLKRGLDFLRPF